jgi:phospholipid transport system substrate-binding protein
VTGCPRTRLAAGVLWLGCALLAMPPPTGAAPAGPTDQLRGAIERVLQVLQDPALKGEAHAAERRRVVRQIVDEIFDFDETARRALAQHWRALDERQRREFIGLFADVIARAYMAKIELYAGEKIQYAGERVDAGLATVSTRLVTKNGTEVPIDYRMHERDGRWRVYDVGIEGVSLIANYRSQFDSIIRTSSYEELIRRMRSRAAETGR